MSIEIERNETEDVKVNLTLVSQQIDQLVQQYKRKEGCVRLLAVSKTKPFIRTRSSV